MNSSLAVVDAPSNIVVDFDPVAAIDTGVLGDQEPLATESGLESVSCCNSVIAFG
ncbi:hypothetical protein [Streptomyces sp. NRRL F-5123]|uniref:hypothetical protein n=1 Tax=Streptomyces sp. NRRL F-5123 TaxID=1463856 RepID=UPI00131E5E1B|nr:hypothetical protein [Streptomyces sp. NRRL F-5123]